MTPPYFISSKKKKHTHNTVKKQISQNGLAKTDWPKLAGKTRWPKTDCPKLDMTVQPRRGGPAQGGPHTTHNHKPQHTITENFPSSPSLSFAFSLSFQKLFLFKSDFSSSHFSWQPLLTCGLPIANCFSVCSSRCERRMCSMNGVQIGARST